MLDGSSSVLDENFKKILKWVNRMVKVFTEKNFNLHVGVLVFRYVLLLKFYELGFRISYNQKIKVVFKEEQKKQIFYYV